MATRQWVRTDVPGKYGVMAHTVTLWGGDSSADLTIPDFSDKTVHIFGGTFGTSTVSVLGLNSSSGTGQDLHRVHDPSLTFTSVATEVLALLLENPLILQASASAGTGTSLQVVVVSKRNT